MCVGVYTFYTYIPAEILPARTEQRSTGVVLGYSTLLHIALSYRRKKKGERKEKRAGQDWDKKNVYVYVYRVALGGVYESSMRNFIGSFKDCNGMSSRSLSLYPRSSANLPRV